MNLYLWYRLPITVIQKKFHSWKKFILKLVAMDDTYLKDINYAYERTLFIDIFGVSVVQQGYN